MIIGLVLALAAVTTLAPGPAGAAAGGGTVSTFSGWAFDTCLTQSLDTMKRWRHSKYRAVGIYYGGRGRACKRQPHLDRGWTRAVQRMGWRLLPVYVGSQSPCVIAKNKKHVRIGKHPLRQGKREGHDAVRKAKALGMKRRSPLYLDMEAYTYREKPCARTTLSFVRAWDREVRRHGYVPGFYSSADSGVRHMEQARRAGVRDLPAVLWFARWHTRPHLYAEREIARHAWRPARRIHQYAGNVKERHGGRTLVIDRNLVHAPVARVR
ncbi:hypothetical protein KY5_3953c [Streptomyces formicae]|uniref:Rv2525c-like glycoside hydrolase-like domain-containing protein n=2 Tax=Streptomyces formicae TaxID=1616117 RepID=A0A291QB89_9ACTN|nr:hypothetical protein KY5_3953c [Streptomyces formicae]